MLTIFIVDREPSMEKVTPAPSSRLAWHIGSCLYLMCWQYFIWWILITHGVSNTPFLNGEHFWNGGKFVFLHLNHKNVLSMIWTTLTLSCFCLLLWIPFLNPLTGWLLNHNFSLSIWSLPLVCFNITELTVHAWVCLANIYATFAKHSASNRSLTISNPSQLELY